MGLGRVVCPPALNPAQHSLTNARERQAGGLSTGAAGAGRPAGERGIICPGNSTEAFGMHFQPAHVL